jgi:hypothetical protein
VWGNQRGKKGKRGEKQAGAQTEAGSKLQKEGNEPANGLGNLRRLVPEVVAIGGNPECFVLEVLKIGVQVQGGV